MAAEVGPPKGTRKGIRPPNAGKGRVKGVPNKTPAILKDMILQALAGVGGVEYLQRQAEDNPGPFLSLVGKVLPLQVTGGDGKDLVIKVMNYGGDNATV